jgi:hypothetical protein
MYLVFKNKQFVAFNMLISIITIALKETILIDLAGNIRFISPLVGASKHDVVHLREQIQKIKSTLSSDEELILDKGYQGIEEDFESNIVHVKHKKPKGKTLCEEKKLENQYMEKIRRKIELAIGNTKNRFAILRTKFRMISKYLGVLAPFLFAVGQLIKEFFNSSNTFETAWTKGVPQLPKKQRQNQKRKKVLLKKSFPFISLIFFNSCNLHYPVISVYLIVSLF